MSGLDIKKAKECVDVTVKGLLSIIKNQPRSNLKQVIQNAIFALEKQKPKRPLDLDDGAGFHDRVLSCPSCKKAIVNVWNTREYKPNFCHYCGQRFDWDKEEDEE